MIDVKDKSYYISPNHIFPNNLLRLFYVKKHTFYKIGIAVSAKTSKTIFLRARENVQMHGL